MRNTEVPSVSSLSPGFAGGEGWGEGALSPKHYVNTKKSAKQLQASLETASRQIAHTQTATVLRSDTLDASQPQPAAHGIATCLISTHEGLA